MAEIAVPVGRWWADLWVILPHFAGTIKAEIVRNEGILQSFSIRLHESEE
jgi:hypothetical protein